MAQHRHTVRMELTTVDHPILANAQTDSSFRVMLFCASEIRAGSMQFVQFPYQSEVKVNGGEIKANLRGLKNKPGSTRPIDITESLRLKPTGYSNTVELTYALTDKERKDGLRVRPQKYFSTSISLPGLLFNTNYAFIEVLYGY